MTTDKQELEKELLDFVRHAITNKEKKRSDDYEHIGATIEAKIKLTFQQLNKKSKL